MNYSYIRAFIRQIDASSLFCDSMRVLSKEGSVVLYDHAKEIAVLCYFCLISGCGDYYCSGNDLSNFANVSPDSMADMAKQGGDILLYVIILSTLCLL